MKIYVLIVILVSVVAGVAIRTQYQEYKKNEQTFDRAMNPASWAPIELKSVCDEQLMNLQNAIIVPQIQCTAMNCVEPQMPKCCNACGIRSWQVQSSEIERSISILATDSHLPKCNLDGCGEPLNDCPKKGLKLSSFAQDCGLSGFKGVLKRISHSLNM